MTGDGGRWQLGVEKPKVQRGGGRWAGDEREMGGRWAGGGREVGRRLAWG